MTNFKYSNKGFTLVEIIVGSALFLIVAVSAYGAFNSLFKIARLNQTKLLAISLANEKFEILRNMPYMEVGTAGGIPSGSLPRVETITRGNISFTVTLTIRNINLIESEYQVSSKLAEVEVSCVTCENFNPVYLTSIVSPANLQSAGSGGALSIQVLDSNGNPVSDASVRIRSTSSGDIDTTDVTNDAGLLNLIGVEPGTSEYHIEATKIGYSTDTTVPITIENPTPAKPHVTVVDQQVSQTTLNIDKLSSMNISSVSPTCTPISNIDFHLDGSRELSVGVPIYNEDLQTDTSGLLNISNLNWDTYVFSSLDAGFDISGFNPLSPLLLGAGVSQDMKIIVTPKSGKALLVSVVDSGTGLPIADANVHINGNGIDDTKVTDKGHLVQANWSNGAGQENFIDASQYFTGNNIDISTAGVLKLLESFGEYNPFGSLESSTFDTGSNSNFYNLYWTPTNQPVDAGENSVKFQLASNEEITATTTWDFVGPDGTNGSYYTDNNATIHNSHSGDRYIRYKVFLSTETSTTTPTISSIAFTYASSCTPPGQVLFSDLLNGIYNIDVTKDGYSGANTVVDMNSDWQSVRVEM